VNPLILLQLVVNAVSGLSFSEQISNYPSTRLRPHKLIGEILLEKGKKLKYSHTLPYAFTE
jgi:hypothetical protein